MLLQSVDTSDYISNKIVLAGKKIIFNQDGTVTWETLT